jgi:hypothetical protein
MKQTCSKLTLILLLTLQQGCTTAALRGLTRELAKDPATVSLRITTVYGTVTFARANPGTNSLPHNVNADGTITVGR